MAAATAQLQQAVAVAARRSTSRRTAMEPVLDTVSSGTALGLHTEEAPEDTAGKEAAAVLDSMDQRTQTPDTDTEAAEAVGLMPCRSRRRLFGRQRKLRSRSARRSGRCRQHRGRRRSRQRCRGFGRTACTSSRSRSRSTNSRGCTGARCIRPARWRARRSRRRQVRTGTTPCPRS